MRRAQEQFDIFTRDSNSYRAQNGATEPGPAPPRCRCNALAFRCFSAPDARSGARRASCAPDGPAQCRESPPAGHSRESHRALWQRRNRTCPCGCGNKTAAHGWPCAALAAGLKRAPATRCPVPAPWRGTGPGAPGRRRARAGASRARESVPVSDWRRGARSSPGSPCLDRSASAGDARPSQAGTRAVHGHMDVPLGAIGESHRVPARVLPCPPPLDSGRARKMKMPSRAQSMPGRYPVESRRGGRPGPARDTGGGACRAGPRFPVASCRPSRNRLASIRPATRRTRIATAPTASSRQRADIDHKPRSDAGRSTRVQESSSTTELSTGIAAIVPLPRCTAWTGADRSPLTATVSRCSINAPQRL